jgi:hypothetical protein
MKDFLDELKEYFKTTPREIILKEWNESVELDAIGPTVEEFLKFSYQNCLFSIPPLFTESQTKLNINSPKYTSGFLLNNKNNYYAKSCIFIN